MLNGGSKVVRSTYMGLTGRSLSASSIGGGNTREQRRPMWTQHEKAVLRLLMREYAGVTEYDPPDIHKHPIKNEMWRLLTARYNDHPNVRNRDTKQLRKAWENLKYRARKLGDLKKSGTLHDIEGCSTNDGPDAPWPLEGIKLSLAGRETASAASPNTRDEFEDETRFVADQDRKIGNNWISEENSGMKGDSPEIPIEKVGRNSVPSIGPASRFGLPYTSGDFLMNGGRGAVLNLQPLVNSLVGGALPALLPFLNPPSAPPLSADLLINNPFISTFFQPLDDSRSEASCSKDSKDEFSRPPSPRPSCEISNWASSLSGTKRVTPGVPSLPLKQVPEEGNGRSALKQEDPVTPSDIGDSPEEGVDDELDLFVLQQKVTELLARRTCEENEHSVTLQCLNLQMAHAEAQHEIKMKILATQLQFWQTKLQLLQESIQKSEDNKE